MALTRDRNTKTRLLTSINFPVAADAVIHQGAMVALNASNVLVPASTSTALRVVGCAAEAVVGGASAGDVHCRVDVGVFLWDNSTAGDEVTLAHFGQPVYAVDDETVAATDGTGTRSPAGIMVGLGTDYEPGVWVAHHPSLVAMTA